MENTLQTEFKKGFTQLKTDKEKGLLGKDLFIALLENWQSRMRDENDTLHSHFFDFFLFKKSVSSGIILTFLVHNQQSKIIAEFGTKKEIIPDLQKILEEKNNLLAAKNENNFCKLINPENKAIYKYFPDTEKLYIYVEQITHTKNHKIDSLNSASKTSYSLVHLLWKKVDAREDFNSIGKMFANYYINHYFPEEKIMVNLFSYFQDELEQIVVQNKKNKDPVQIYIFHFQKFNNFFKFVGEFFASDIIEEIAKNISSRLKKEDKYYQISPRIHITVSPNCSNDTLKKRFKGIFFQIKGIILEYKVKNYEIQTAIDLDKLWPELFPERTK